MKFNPPPNWPPVSDGWTPPSGWAPPPDWPDPPYGWPLWLPGDGQPGPATDTSAYWTAPPEAPAIPAHPGSEAADLHRLAELTAEGRSKKRQRAAGLGAVAFLLLLWGVQSGGGPDRDAPAEQMRFLDTVTEHREQAEDTENDVTQTRIFDSRIRALCSYGRSPVTGWVGTLDAVRTGVGGDASVTVDLGDDVLITTGGTLANLTQGTRIDAADPIVGQLAELETGDTVTIRGEFATATNGSCETSPADAGDLEDPEFLFRFVALTPRA